MLKKNIKRVFVSLIDCRYCTGTNPCICRDRISSGFYGRRKESFGLAVISMDANALSSNFIS